MACPSIQSFFRFHVRVCLLALLAMVSPAFAAKTVTLVLSQDAPVYHSFAAAFRLSLASHDRTTSVLVISNDKFQADEPPATDMLVAVGYEAAEALGQRNLQPPLLITMVPREGLQPLLTMQPNARGLYVDQPPARYLSLVRAALPRARRIGILTGPDGGATARELRHVAHKMHLEVHVETVTSTNSLHTALQHIITHSDVLLTIPDATIFNRQSIPGIIMSAYRHNVPVVGFSPAYIDAGALVALYSTPEQLARQSADICHKVLSGSSASTLNFPMQYTIGINGHIAQSMNRTMEKETVIRARMKRQERQP